MDAIKPSHLLLSACIRDLKVWNGYSWPKSHECFETHSAVLSPSCFPDKKTSCAIFCPSEQLTIQNYLTKLLYKTTKQLQRMGLKLESWLLENDCSIFSLSKKPEFHLPSTHQTSQCDARGFDSRSILEDMKRISVSLERLFFSFSWKDIIIQVCRLFKTKKNHISMFVLSYLCFLWTNPMINGLKSL